MGSIFEKFFFRDPNPDKFKYPLDSVYVDEDGKEYPVEFNIEESGKYKRQFQNQPQPVKEEIKKIRKGIKAGYLYDDSPNVGGEDTHSLGRDTSKYDNKKEVDSVIWSKKINTMNRLNYRIYKPRWNEDQRKFIMKIVLENCQGHGEYKNPNNPQQKTYSVIKIGRTTIYKLKRVLGRR